MQNSSQTTEVNSRKGGFRDYIPPRDVQRSKDLAASDTYQWSNLRCADPFVIGWKQSWEELYNEPYKGITTDGIVLTGLYPLEKGQDQGAPTTKMVKAAKNILASASPKEKMIMSNHIEAPEWRRWSNPEIYTYKQGVRLEEVSEDLVTAIYTLMRASLSPAGYAKARGCMKVNRFLGEVVDGRKVLNEKSYNFSIFGQPSEVTPWGWQLFGHHFCMNVFVLRSQMVISPVFMGAEPNVIDEGPDKGMELFTDQEKLALQLMQSLDQEITKDARIYQQLSGEEYPAWRFHRADQRHLGGAFQDNRTIPYEGVKVSNFTLAQQEMVCRLVTLSLNSLPENVLKARMAEISAHWADTYFCWIGGCQDQDAFYYKVHSPVVMVEFDHHTGVFLNNKVPLPFHIHTLVRTPNGNDYGKSLLKQYQQGLDAMKL